MKFKKTLPCLTIFYLGLFLFMATFSTPLFAVNAPVITHVMGKPVVAGATQYANVTTGVQIRGNAEAGTTIRLFRDNVQVGTTLADLSGVWTVTFNTSEGKSSYNADANDGTFTSAKCPAVDVHVDIQPPYGYVCNGWSYLYVRSSYYNSTYYYNTVYETGGTAGSGLDFTTASMTIIDLTANVTIPTSISTDNINKLNFTPLPNDTALKVDGHEYWCIVEVADKAGNVMIASKTFYCDMSPPVTTIQRIYDPAHTIITGSGEPNPNTPDADGFVAYYPSMTISTQPTKIRGMTSPPSNYGEGFGTYYISSSYASTAYLSNGFIDALGSFTIPLTSKFYTGTTSFGVWTYDSAYNNAYTSYTLKFDNPCPDPVIKKVYDPAHHDFSGTGETAANTPDVDGYVNYFPNMKISTRPTTLIGTIDPGNMYYFRLYNALSGNLYCYVGTQIDAVTGSFTAPLNADFYNATHNFTWYIYNDSSGYQTRNTSLIFIDGNPAPPNQISSLNFTQYSYNKIPTDAREIPTITGLASPYAYPQTIWLRGVAGGAVTTDYQYATVVLPSGQGYPSVAGSYDTGDVWQDKNQNGQWESDEPFYDMPPRGVSDGRSFTIPNFLGVQANDNMNYTCMFYAYARSPFYDSSIYYGYYWFSQWTYPHQLQTLSLLPAVANPYRNNALKPTQLTVECYKPSGTYSPSNIFGLRAADSNISITNALNQVLLPNTSNWTYLGTPDRYSSVISLLAYTFAEGTYDVNVHLINEMNVVTDDSSNYFVIDNTAPLAQDFAPAEGAVSNSFTSFNARIVDQYLSDNSEGSGANLDVAIPQIWPFRLLTNQYYNPNVNTNTITFTLGDGELYAKNHVGAVLAPGTTLEAWEVLSGQYQNIKVAVTVLNNPGDGTLTVKTSSGAIFTKRMDFVVLFPIPSFTSNNGLDRVGAVPISPVTEDAQYVCRVITLDKSGNTGAFFAPYSKLELAAGPITLTTDRTFLFMGLVPPDIATFTSSTILTRKMNIVQDNQAVTIQRSPENLTEFTLPDANGLPGDGYQVYTGQNGATPGAGMFVYGVEVTGTSTSVLNTICGIGLASGSSTPIPIVRIDPFSLVPATTTPAITPGNPTGDTSVSCSLIGYSGTPVPDGSLATWTMAAHQLENPTGAMYTMNGYHTSYWNPNGLSDGNFSSYGQYFYNPSYSAPTPGSGFTIDLGAGNEKEWVRVDYRSSTTSHDLLFDVQFSDNGTSWTTAASNLKPSSVTSKLEWPYYGKHRYWRVYQTNTPTYYWGYLYELSWYTNPARPNVSPDLSPLPGIQATVVGGSTSVFVSAEKKGPVSFTMEVGGRSASCVITFLDRYPPDPPATIALSPQYSQGSTQISWAESIDHGGAGTQDYFVQQSMNGGPFSSVLTIATTTAGVSGLLDGDYLFQIVARDADGNIGNPSVATFCVVDTVPPPAVDCSDIGVGNQDPDEFFSVDPNISFYFNPTDDHSGVAEVNVQVATASDFSVIAHDVWVPAANEYVFTDGLSGFAYYARVRAKDRSGNIGPFGTPSNGIIVHYSGATTPPNAPIISSIDGKPAIPGVPVTTKNTVSVPVVGMSESSNLVEIWLNGVYVRSVISSIAGNYTHLIDMPAGVNWVKTRSHNGFAQSAFSAEFQVIVDTIPPTMDLRIYMTGNWLVDRNWLSRGGNQHNIEYFYLVVSDTGGAGFDINVASITVVDIDDSDVPLPSTASYPNPLIGTAGAIAADTAKYVPDAGWPAALQDQHKYRIYYEVSDLAGNRAYATRDIAIDSLRPGQAAEVPATSTPPMSDFEEIFVYNLASYPSGLPPADALVPTIWSAGDNAYIVDPSFNDPRWVDNATTPVALLFNTPGIYGHVYSAGSYNPPPQTNFNTLAYSTGIAWGWGSSISLTTNALGHKNWFRYPYRTIVNGPHLCTFYIQDSAICRDLPNLKLNILSPVPAPHPPTSVQFFDATDPSLEFPTIVWTNLFAIPGNWMYALDTVITNNSNPLMVKVKVPIETFDQTVEAYYGSTMYASATVPAGSEMAVMLLSMTGTEYRRKFQIRTRANGYISMNLPRESSGWYYGYIRDDVKEPTAYDLIPIERNYNALTGASARPFPGRFSLRAADTTNGTDISWVNIPSSYARLQNIGGTSISGTLTREYDPPATAYGFRYDLSSIPTTEGTYYYHVNLVDGAQPAANSFVASYAFRLDKSAPSPSNVSPGDGVITNSLPSFSCQSVDPLLADGTEGSGPNMDPTLAQVVPYKELGRNLPTGGGSIQVTIVGIDTTATDHVDNVLPIGTAVAFAKVSGTSLEPPQRFGVISANGGDLLSASITSGSAFVLSETYAVLWQIPTFQSNDGIDRLAAVPIQPAVKGGAYVAYFTLTDKSLNKGTYSSASSIYEAAYGPFSLTPDRTSLYAGLIPPHAANYVSGQILTTEGNPVQLGTQVTVFTQPQLGSFGPADSNGIPGDGHQVVCDGSGVLHFQLLASGTATGLAKVKAVIGLANGSDSSVIFVPLPAYSVNPAQTTLTITPGNLNPSTVITAGTFGNAGDLVPDGTMLNASTTLGNFFPADAMPAWPKHQIPITSGNTSFSFTSGSAGTANLSFECGGVTVTKTITVIDQAPPTAPGTPDISPMLSGTGNLLITWGSATDPGNSGISSYELEYSLNGGAWTSLTTVALPIYNTVGLAHGMYKFRARAIDGAGNVGPYGTESAQVEVDRLPPFGTITINSGAARTATTTVTLTLSATDTNGVTNMAFSNDGTTWTSWRTMATSYVWDLTPVDGGKIVYARFQDSLGNISVPLQDGIILDTTPPAGSIAISPAPFSATQTVQLSLNAVDGAGVSQMSLNNEGQGVVSMAYVSSYQWNLAPGLGTHTVTISFVDALGNRSASMTASTFVDNVKPLPPTVTDDGIYSPFIDKLHATWSSSDANSGLDHFIVRVGTSAGAADVVADTNVGLASETTFSGLTLDLSGSTLYYFTVWAYDKVGNVSNPGYTDGIKGGDPTPPLPVTITDDGAYSADKTILHASWNASSDPDSGINRYEFSAGTTAGGTNTVPWTDLGLALNYTKTGLSLTNGQIYYINVKVWNNGGTSTVSISDGITIDIVPPPVPVLDAEPAYSSGTVNIVSCPAVTDALSGGVQYYFESATDAAFSAGLVNSGWISVPTYTFSSLTHGLTYYFRVKSRDAVLNESAYSGVLSSIQDSNPPTCVSYTDNVAGNNDPDETWSQDLNVSFAADTLTDDLSGVKNVYVQIATENTFAAPLWEDWLGNTTGAKTYVVPSVDGSTIYAQAKYEDVAGNISAYYKTNGISIDLSDPSAGATTDIVAGNNDKDEKVSSDTWLYFDFTHSDAISGVADVRIQVASDVAFAQIATDVWIGSNVTSYLFKNGADFSTYWARIMVKDNASRVSAWGGSSNGIRVDMSAPADPGSNMFFVNKPASQYVDEATTATPTVYLTLTISDPSGVASASVSNDGVSWTVWTLPSLDPASRTWILTPNTGTNTIRMVFEDGVGNVSSIASKTILYYPNFNINVGNRDDKTYPVDTYDEYRGQNKYGTDRSTLNNPNEGKSLKLETP